ncbi:ScyD/ScyE family protein [Actinoplanes sp. CA-252034]|uniref:ScyD/ScyE family protein n=1 Tax=Actinoplanes sp. CA-252034 TaxID=3239906 RepID=UPI003D97D160
MVTIRSYLAVLGLLIAGPADPGLPLPGRPSVEIVARGLDNPRGLAFGGRGELFVAEAGRGGPACRPTVEGGSVCSGVTGAITVVEFGRQWRIRSGLPSEASPAGTGATGPSDVTIGADGEPLHTATSEPCGLYRDTNLLTAVPAPVAVAGTAVLDARRRALVRLTPRGRVQTIATFEGPAGPSSVTVGPDGAWYVGERFDPSAVRSSAARIWRVEPGRAPTVWASGFTGVVDLAWGPDNRLHVLEEGALTSIDASGKRRSTATAALHDPGGLAIRGGHAYVSTCSTCKDTGAVLRIRL